MTIPRITVESNTWTTAGPVGLQEGEPPPLEIAVFHGKHLLYTDCLGDQPAGSAT